MNENKSGTAAPLTDKEKLELLREWATLQRERGQVFETWGDLTMRISAIEKRLIEDAGEPDEVAG